MGQVEIKGIAKRFGPSGEVRALDGVDLSVEEGEFLVLLGPSGSGKTTLMRIIAGLETPTAGEISIGGRVVNELPPRVRNIAMVFQSYALYPHMTAFDNIAFPLKTQRVDRATIKKKVEGAAELFDIGRLLHRKPAELSGGERQRVALARAIVREPTVFLMDEPLSNLDAKLRASARDELKEFQRRIGITTLYVTHDQVEAMGLGDRIVVLDQGQVHQVGAPREIYDHPADTFVATFVGTPPMNMVERDEMIVGFRPENFLPKALQSSADDLVSIPYRITNIEFLGSQKIVYGSLLDGHDALRVIACLPASAPVTVGQGESQEFAVLRKDLRFFDKATGRRMEPPDEVFTW